MGEDPGIDSQYGKGGKDCIGAVQFLITHNLECRPEHYFEARMLRRGKVQVGLGK